MLKLRSLLLIVFAGVLCFQLLARVESAAHAQEPVPTIPAPPYLEPTPVKEDVEPGTWVFQPDGPDASSVLTSILGTGDSSIHGMVYYNSYLWASTRTEPGRILQIDPTTLTVVNRATLLTNRNNAEDIVAANGYLWSIAVQTNGVSYLVRVDPSTMVVGYTRILLGNDLFLAESLEYNFGYLWVGGYNGIAKIDISNPLIPSIISVYDFSSLVVEDYMLGTALSSDSNYLYTMFTQGNFSPGEFITTTLVRINPNNPTGDFLPEGLDELFPDDMVSISDSLYTSSELSGLPSVAYRFPIDITPYITQTAFSVGVSYGVFSNPLEADTFWGAYTGSPGTLIKFDLDMNQLWSFQLPTAPSNFNDPSEIVFDGSGNMYVATFTDPARLVKYTLPDSVLVSISKSGNNALLSWTNSDSFVDHYEVWRSTSPYFNPGDAGSVKVDVSATMGAMSYTHVGALGDVNTNYYYVVRAFNDFGLLAPISNRVGEFDRELRETTGSDFNWIGLPLSTNLSMASDLATYIQNNSSAAVTVAAIEEWNSVGQNYQTFIPPSSGNFSLNIGGVYRVSVDVASGSSVVWSLMGSVPGAGSIHYTLRETTTSDFNWAMVPLDKSAITMASGLKADIDSTAVPATTVLAVEEWNVVGQNYQSYVPPSGDFGVRIGYPYRVSVDVSSGSTSVWP